MDLFFNLQNYVIIEEESITENSDFLQSVLMYSFAIATDGFS